MLQKERNCLTWFHESIKLHVFICFFTLFIFLHFSTKNLDWNFSFKIFGYDVFAAKFLLILTKLQILSDYTKRYTPWHTFNVP